MSLRTIDFRSDEASRSDKDLLMLLPGAQMRPEEIVDAGVPQLAAKRAPMLDLCLVDLGADNITGDKALASLAGDLLAPARRQYRHVWLGGISLGGLLALCHAADHPGTIDGLCLLAPYAGSRITLNTIDKAGGIAQWQPDAQQIADPEFRVWQWLKAPPALPIFFGYGADDRFADNILRLATCLPNATRSCVSGGHGWAAWLPLWAEFLNFYGIRTA